MLFILFINLVLFWIGETYKNYNKNSQKAWIAWITWIPVAITEVTLSGCQAEYQVPWIGWFRNKGYSIILCQVLFLIIYEKYFIIK